MNRTFSNRAFSTALGMALLTSAILGGGSTFAADLSVTPAVRPYYAAPVTTWTGCYLGVVGGWGRGSINDVSGHADGGNIGGTLGCNIQTDSWIWGVEGDALWSGIKEGDASFLQVKNDFLGSVRARLGVASPTALLYATGGLGVGRGSITVLGSEASNTHYGWTLGGGLEWMISPNWTGKVEYLHYDLGKETYGGVLNAGFNVDTVRVGLNYKFGL